MLLSRFTCSLIYYAMAFNTGELHGDIYINTFIAGAVEVPAYVLCLFTMDWKLMGRKWTGSCGLIVSGISSFLCIPMLIFGQRISITSQSTNSTARHDSPNLTCAQTLRRL